MIPFLAITAYAFLICIAYAMLHFGKHYQLPAVTLASAVLLGLFGCCSMVNALHLALAGIDAFAAAMLAVCAVMAFVLLRLSFERQPRPVYEPLSD